MKLTNFLPLFTFFYTFFSPSKWKAFEWSFFFDDKDKFYKDFSFESLKSWNIDVLNIFHRLWKIFSRENIISFKKFFFWWSRESEVRERQSSSCCLLLLCQQKSDIELKFSVFPWNVIPKKRKNLRKVRKNIFRTVGVEWKTLRVIETLKIHNSSLGIHYLEGIIFSTKKKL